eukprot:2211652-Rhodomonas_salina.1
MPCPVSICLTPTQPPSTMWPGSGFWHYLVARDFSYAWIGSPIDTTIASRSSGAATPSRSLLARMRSPHPPGITVIALSVQPSRTTT